MLTAAFLLPIAVGLNFTVTLQLAFAPIPVPQVLLCRKSPAFVPVMLMLEIFSGVLAVLVSISVCEGLTIATASSSNARLKAERETTVPVPPIGMAFGLPGSDVLMPMPDCLQPFIVGVNVIEITQLALAESISPQVSVSAKSPAFTPPKSTLLTNS